MHLAGASYCVHSNSWSCGYHCDSVDGILDVTVFTAARHLQAYVAYDALQKVIVLAFAGTDDPRDWITNLDFGKSYPIKQFPHVAVHEGFWDAWQDLKLEAIAVIAGLKTRHGTNRVLAVGHSLGGALASLAALDLTLSSDLHASVMSYGAPRSGNGEYHKLVHERISYNWRITHHHDLVVHLPPQRLGFYHTATEIHFPKRGDLSYKVCDGSGEDPRCANSCSWVVGGVCTSISDHLHYLGVGIASCTALASSNSTEEVIV